MRVANLFYLSLSIYINVYPIFLVGLLPLERPFSVSVWCGGRAILKSAEEKFHISSERNNYHLKYFCRSYTAVQDWDPL